MPSLVRFLVVLALLAAVVLGAMGALVTFVRVTPRTMEQPISPARLR